MRLLDHQRYLSHAPLRDVLEVDAAHPIHGFLVSDSPVRLRFSRNTTRRTCEDLHSELRIYDNELANAG
jgi:hypothetical protein